MSVESTSLNKKLCYRLDHNKESVINASLPKINETFIQMCIIPNNNNINDNNSKTLIKILKIMKKDLIIMID